VLTNVQLLVLGVIRRLGATTTNTTSSPLIFLTWFMGMGLRRCWTAAGRLSRCGPLNMSQVSMATIIYSSTLMASWRMNVQTVDVALIVPCTCYTVAIQPDPRCILPLLISCSLSLLHNTPTQGLSLFSRLRLVLSMDLATFLLHFTLLFC
jgi:hypothetical protein